MDTVATAGISGLSPRLPPHRGRAGSACALSLAPRTVLTHSTD